jgi:1,2-dihydroxy-3-keto-5-methylthiopentene dioxygenase
MAILNVPDRAYSTRDTDIIRDYLNQSGIWFDQWIADKPLSDDADQETVLAAYEHVLKPFMEKNGYQTVDVINMNAQTPQYDSLRNKFLSEHRHTEDEVRFFVDGKGCFWFNPEEGEVFNVVCEAGDLISVPANTRHWFDAGKDEPFVKAIRIFIDQSGWVPHYTESGIDLRYNP